jgi:hypothetical protein
VTNTQAYYTVVKSCKVIVTGGREIKREREKERKRERVSERGREKLGE